MGRKKGSKNKPKNNVAAEIRHEDEQQGAEIPLEQENKGLGYTHQ